MDWHIRLRRGEIGIRVVALLESVSRPDSRRLVHCFRFSKCHWCPSRPAHKITLLSRTTASRNTGCSVIYRFALLLKGDPDNVVEASAVARAKFDDIVGEATAVLGDVAPPAAFVHRPTAPSMLDATPANWV